MSTGASLEVRDGVPQVRGTLDFSTVSALWEQGLALFRDGSGDIRLDVSAVDRIDSAGVALLVEWMRLVRGRGGDFSITGAPPAMKDLIRLADLEDLLPVMSFQ